MKGRMYAEAERTTKKGKYGSRKERKGKNVILPNIEKVRALWSF